MTEPGWYVDYENPKQMRYHDGAVWTGHVHDDRKNLPAAPVPPAVQDTIVYDPEAQQRSLASRMANLAIVGLFVGFMLGAFIFNGVGAITPTTETSGTLERIEIEYSTSSNSRNRQTHVLSGTTAAGEPWRIADEDAYNIVQSQGYPQSVTLAMGDWTGTPERVSGRSFVVDHQTTNARIGWAAMIGGIAVLSLVAAFFIARAKSQGPWVALAFLVSVLGPGAWLGYQGVQWIQSG